MEIKTRLESASRLGVEVHGDTHNNEYHAALQLKAIIEDGLADGDEGLITLHPSITLFGQKNRDVDIFLVARFSKGLRRDLFIPKHSNTDTVAFFNIVATIEVKDHCPEDVEFRDLAAWVPYKSKMHSATLQSEGQKYSAVNYFSSQLGWKPFVCNLIWFRNLRKSDFPAFPNNYLGSDSNFDDLLEKLILTTSPACPYYHENSDPKWRFYCISSKNASDLAVHQLQLFSLLKEQRKGAGVLTRKKLENLTKALLKDQQYAQSIGQRLVVIQGRAGTGKTVKLLHIAYDLCTNRGQRVLILTYNRMLVSDLQRMVTLAGIRSDIDKSTIEIETIHSYVWRLLQHFGISFDVDKFLVRYEELKATLLQYLNEGLITEADLNKFKYEKRAETSWDIVLVDEGQDWPENEKQILYRLFDSKNVVVASGTGQLVRSVQPADWARGVDCNRPPRDRRSLRQKRNLCEFQRLYAEAVSLNWDLEPSADLTGGKVVLVCGHYTQTIHERFFAKCKQDENSAYEYMFLAPPTLTVQKGDNYEFSQKEQFESWGIKLWDGVSRDNRTEYPTDVHEHRVITYESARGLEGWVVVCLALDEFVDYKRRNPYIIDTAHGYSGNQMLLGMQSREEQIEELVNEWTMIALTRAIDTVIITLANPSSPFAQKLLGIAKQCGDFIEVLDGQEAGTSGVGFDSGGARAYKADAATKTTSSHIVTLSSIPSRTAPAPERVEIQRKPARVQQVTLPALQPKPITSVNQNLHSNLPVPTLCAESSVARDILARPWVVEFFFRRVHEGKLSFGVQQTHKYTCTDVGVGLKQEVSDQRVMISMMVRRGLVEITKREHYYGHSIKSNLEYPSPALAFSYRITEKGIQQAHEWLRQVNEGKLKIGQRAEWMAFD